MYARPHGLFEEIGTNKGAFYGWQVADSAFPRAGSHARAGLISNHNHELMTALP